MKKYRSFETFNRPVKDGLTSYLKSSGIYYEISGCFDGWHFEILCDSEEAEKINSWLAANA